MKAYSDSTWILMAREPIVFLLVPGNDDSPLAICTIGAKWYDDVPTQHGFVEKLDHAPTEIEFAHMKLRFTGRLIKWGWTMYIRPRWLSRWLSGKVLSFT